MAKQKRAKPERASDIDPRTLPPGTKVWLYLRHSPGEDQTIESQQHAITTYCREKGWDITRCFIDERISGDAALEDRPGFGEMMYLAKQQPREGDVLVIWDYARFSRDPNLAQLCRAELRYHGWQILSINDQIPSGPFAPLFEALIDWKNAQFLIDLRASTRRGLMYLAQRGYVATGKIAKGYSFSQEQLGTSRSGKVRYGRRPEIDPDIMPLVIHAFELKAEGAPHEVIAAETGLLYWLPPSSA